VWFPQNISGNRRAFSWAAPKRQRSTNRRLCRFKVGQGRGIDFSRKTGDSTVHRVLIGKGHTRLFRLYDREKTPLVRGAFTLGSGMGRAAQPARFADAGRLVGDLLGPRLDCAADLGRDGILGPSPNNSITDDQNGIQSCSGPGDGLQSCSDEAGAEKIEEKLPRRAISGQKRLAKSGRPSAAAQSGIGRALQGTVTSEFRPKRNPLAAQKHVASIGLRRWLGSICAHGRAGLFQVRAGERPCGSWGAEVDSGFGRSRPGWLSKHQTRELAARTEGPRAGWPPKVAREFRADNRAIALGRFGRPNRLISSSTKAAGHCGSGTATQADWR